MMGKLEDQLNGLDKQLNRIEAISEVLKSQQNRFETYSNDHNKHLEELKSGISEHIQEAVLSVERHFKGILDQIPVLIDEKQEERFKQHAQTYCVVHKEEIQNIEKRVSWLEKKQKDTDIKIKETMPIYYRAFHPIWITCKRNKTSFKYALLGLVAGILLMILL
jgi:chromosome segregation ATPase